MIEKAPDPDSLWKQYQFYLDLYKFYLDLALKTNAFFYAITGGILTFYFAHSEEKLIKYSLLLPILMSTALGVYFLFGALLSRRTRDQIATLVDQLRINIDLQVWILTIFLLGSAMIFFVVAIAMILLITLR